MLLRDIDMRLLFPVLLSLLPTTPLLAADVGPLIDAEAAFAKDVAELGVRDGFLRHLTDESVVFRPLPTAARAWFEAQPDPDFLLSWRPWFVEISASRDFGYTIGPWTSRPLSDEGAAVSHGFYVTVWIKDVEGAWRPLADHGIGGTELAKVRDEVAALGTAGRSDRISGSYLLNTRYQGLMARTLRLPLAQAEADGNIESDWLAEDLIVLRAGREPLQGEEAARQIMARELGATPPALTVMAESGDLGMSLGGEPGRGAYLRLWRHHDNAGWQLAAEVATAVAVGSGE